MNESIEKQLQRLGWELRSIYWPSIGYVWRAECGGFSTEWRKSEQAVLNDVLAIKSKENAECIGEQKARFA